MARFGEYELLARLGQGGMAEVYLARAQMAEGLYKIVALKRIHPALSENPQFARMFVEEAKIASELNHPNIVQVFHFGKLERTYYLVMEYVEGLDLGRLVRRFAKRMPPGLAAFVVQNVAAGLDYAHRKRDMYGRPLEIVHRDISPQNILISFDGAVKIADFGIARARGQDEEEGVVKGKFAYMSPEQALGQPVDARSDIYSVGVVLYELLAGKAPFGHLKGKEALEAVRRSEIPPLRERAPGVPETLERIVMRCVARDPAQRYQSARELRDALARYVYATAAREGMPFDAAALGAFVEQVVPPDKRLDVTDLVRRGPEPSLVTSAPVVSVVEQTPVEAVERKRVFVLFGRYHGHEEVAADSPEKWRSALKRLWRRAGDLAFKWEVRLRRADEKGLCLVVGLPLAGEEDGVRAVALAKTLQEAVAQAGEELKVPLRLRLGIVRGEAEVRRGGGGNFQYRLLGHVAQLAEQVASRAEPGSVLVGSGVYQAAKRSWVFESAGQLEFSPAEGAAEPSRKLVSLYRLLRPKPKEDRTALFVQAGLGAGRELELEELRKAYRNVASAGRARVVALVGESGLGKRSVVERFLESAEPRPARVLRVTGRQWYQNLPFAVMGDLVRDLLRLDEDTDSEGLISVRIDSLLRALWRHEGPDVEAHGRILRLLVAGPDTVEAELPPDPQLRQRMVGRTLHLVISRLARRGPVVAVFEEFHWADPGSRQLLLRFLESLPEAPVLVILTSRQPTGKDALLEHPAVDVLWFKELDRETARRLVASRFLDPEGARPLIDQVVAKGGGNPFYLLAILDDLVERGVCREEKTADGLRLVWERTESTIQIPATVESLVSARLDRLEASLRKVVRCASVLGRVFRVKHLEELVGQPVVAALQELEEKGLVEPTSEDRAQYQFSNQLVADVAYASLSKNDLRRLHEKAARIFMQEEGGPGQDAMVAMHLAKAGRVQEAGRLYAKAGLEARRFNANREALSFLALALKHAGQDTELEFEVRMAREEILARWGRRQEQRQELERLRELAETSAQRARVSIRWMTYYQATSQPKRVLEEFEPAWAAAEEAADPDLLAEVLYCKARALSELGQNRAALQVVQEARGLCSEPGRKSRVWGELYRVEGNAWFYLGEYEKAAAAYREALQVFRQLGLQLNEAVILNNLGFMHYSVGDFEPAIVHLKAAYDIYKRLGDRSSIATTLSNLGQVYGTLGAQEQGLRYLQRAEQHCRTIQDASFRADALISIGQIHLAKGEMAEALEALREGLALATQAESTYDMVRGEIYLALALVQEGPYQDLETARRLAQDAVEASRKAAMPQGEVFGLSALALAQAASGQIEEAVATSTTAVARLASVRHLAETEVIFYHHARLLLEAGRRDEALPYLEKAYQAVQIKANKVKDEAFRRSYLSIPPARDIVQAYEEQVAQGQT